MSHIDLSFQLSAKAMAVLELLKSDVGCFPLSAYKKEAVHVVDLAHLEIQTSPLYNCRERGICLRVDVDAVDDRLKRMLIFFAEHRRTDQLFVWWQETNETFLNPPTMNAFSEQSYEARKFFGANIVTASKFICNLIGDFHKRYARQKAA